MISQSKTFRPLKQLQFFEGPVFLGYRGYFRKFKGQDIWRMGKKCQKNFWNCIQACNIQKSPFQRGVFPRIVFYFREVPSCFPEVSFYFSKMPYCFSEVSFYFSKMPYCFPEVSFYFSKMLYCFPEFPFSFPEVSLSFLTVRVIFQEYIFFSWLDLLVLLSCSER